HDRRGANVAVVRSGTTVPDLGAVGIGRQQTNDRLSQHRNRERIVDAVGGVVRNTWRCQRVEIVVGRQPAFVPRDAKQETVVAVLGGGLASRVEAIEIQRTWHPLAVVDAPVESLGLDLALNVNLEHVGIPANSPQNEYL